MLESEKLKARTDPAVGVMLWQILIFGCTKPLN